MWYWIADSQKSCTRKAARNYDSNVVTRTRKTFQSAAYKNMFFTTLLIDVTPLEYNELNAGVRSHKTEDKWPQKCTVVINTGFTKQKIQNNGLLEELRKQKREGETPLFCEQPFQTHTKIPQDWWTIIHKLQTV